MAVCEQRAAVATEIIEYGVLLTVGDHYQIDAFDEQVDR